MNEHVGPYLLPPNVVQVAVSFCADDTAWSSIPQERMLPPELRTASRKRRQEYLAGRHCARAAIQRIIPEFNGTIGRGGDRAPSWPEGVAGSITHTQGFAAAAVAPVGVARAIGIDTELFLATDATDSLQALILGGDGVLPASELPRNVLCTLIFSAKESLFKCLYGQVAKMFWLQDAQIVALEREHFHAHLMVDLGGEFEVGWRAQGTFVLERDRVHTAVVLPPR
jgi:enterobactin synthetase component D